jgi:hypothetical protein
MTLFDGLLLLLAVAGLTLIFVHATIMDKLGLRQLWQKWNFTKELFNCSMCSAVWLSIYAILAIYVKLQYSPIYYYIMTLPFACSAFSFLWERASILIDEKIIESEQKRRD